MPARDDHRRCPKPHRGWAVLIALAGLFVPLGIRADDDGIYYSRQTTFRIPFQIDPGDRRVAQVRLHVSNDRGQTWQEVATAAPTDRGFNFTARQDGWYYFTVQTMDQDRKLYPDRLDNVAPGLRVFVDTVPPDVKLRAMTGLAQGQLGVDWDIREEELDLKTIKLEYRSPGQFWQEKMVQRLALGQLRWEAPAPGNFEVRLQVKDKAGNLGESTTRVRADGRGMDRADEPPMPPGVANQGEEPQISKVNSKRVSLNYKIDDIGPSDISTVEIWLTRDGRAWQRSKQNAGKTPPFIIDIEEGEGRYGITLIAKSGVGLGERPPRPGDQPQVWVEVDLTKPEVQIVDVVVGQGLDKGNLHVQWTARDRNLSRQPITISYATVPEGPFTVVPGASKLENSGRFTWGMPTDVPFKFFLRVEAADEAGNVGIADRAKEVVVDLATPKVKVLGVEAVKQP